MSDSKLVIHWIDHGRMPKHAPDPAYPDGIDIDLSHGAERSCFSPLPHPTPRCGMYHVACKRCGQDALITTAGRPDDPRSVKLRCK